MAGRLLEAAKRFYANYTPAYTRPGVVRHEGIRADAAREANRSLFTDSNVALLRELFTGKSQDPMGIARIREIFEARSLSVLADKTGFPWSRRTKYSDTEGRVKTSLTRIEREGVTGAVMHMQTAVDEIQVDQTQTYIDGGNNRGTDYPGKGIVFTNIVTGPKRATFEQYALIIDPYTNLPRKLAMQSEEGSVIIIPINEAPSTDARPFITGSRRVYNAGTYEQREASRLFAAANNVTAAASTVR